MFKFVKRTIDIVISGISLILLSPLFLVVALLIKRDSPGPIFFLQKRVGFRGSIFMIYKFRTMNIHMKGSHSTENNDPRITKVGKFLRKTSIDELPQLLNVLKGEMTLIGPRPDVPEQQRDYTEEEWEKRQSVHPGLTGLAQALLRSTATPEERIGLDLEYVQNRSLSLDVKIVWITFRSLFSGKVN
jgi:lipopolysaccharide/colanic/teichoic acid biosynthesis glycosyltransferase